MVVQRYVASYRHARESATQSAIDLAQLGDVVEAVDQLARQLLAGIKTASVAAALLGARRRTLQFFDGLYVDLHHLAENVATSTGLGRVTDACRDLQRLLDGQDATSHVIAQGHVGAGIQPVIPDWPFVLPRAARIGRGRPMRPHQKLVQKDQSPLRDLRAMTLPAPSGPGGCMAYREVTMLEVKDVLRLWLSGVRKKRIAAQLGLNIKTVRRYLGAAQAHGLTIAATPDVAGPIHRECRSL